MNQKNELKTRILAKKHRLEARLSELQADARELKADALAKSREETTRIERALEELPDNLQSGWDSLTEDVAAKLNGWLGRSDGGDADPAGKDR